MIITSAIKVIVVLFIATILIYFGYRLFYLAETKSGNLEIESKLGKVRLIKATPGIFLTFFGTTILVVALSKGSTLEVPNSQDPTSMIKGSFSSVASKVEDFKLCAQEVHWAMTVIKSSTVYTRSADSVRANMDRHLEDLQTVLAQCVDSAVGAGAYSKYSGIQTRLDKGETSNANSDEKEIHEKVSDLLAG